MHVLVAYATRHGATQGIAERIAETLRASGIDAEARPAASVKDPDRYDAFVVGSAAYMFHWLKDATRFVHRARATLATRPVWLFSSGPLGTEPIDAQGVDQKVSADPEGAAGAPGDARRTRPPRLLRRLRARAHSRSGSRSASCRSCRQPATPSRTATSATGREIEAWAATIARGPPAVPVG